MELILRRIPEDTRRDEIVAFIEPALAGGWFKKAGYISSIRIISLKDTRTGIVEHHGLVTVEPDVVAERVIRMLRMAYFKGKSSGIREYFYRSWHNDRRDINTIVGKDIQNRRKGDRRRPMEVVRCRPIDVIR